MYKKDGNNEYGIITCYGSVFNVQDAGGDIIKPGSFIDTIKEKTASVKSGQTKYLLPMLWQHEMEKPIGGWTSLQEDSYGLLCTGQILLSLPKGLEAYNLLKDDIIYSFSIGYDVMPGGASWEGGARILTKLRLWEISLVTFPMCEQAVLQSVKSVYKHDFNYYYNRLARA